MKVWMKIVAAIVEGVALAVAAFGLGLRGGPGIDQWFVSKYAPPRMCEAGRMHTRTGRSEKRKSLSASRSRRCGRPEGGVMRKGLRLCASLAGLMMLAWVPASATHEPPCSTYGGITSAHDAETGVVGANRSIGFGLRTEAGTSWDLNLVATNGTTGTITWTGWGVTPAFHEENTFFVATKDVRATHEFVCIGVTNNGTEAMVYQWLARRTG